MQYDIFISYKRRGTSSATAAYIYDLLTKKGYSVFFDRKEMRNGSFNKQLYEHIENAKDILILLEEGSLQSCFSEMKEAYKTDWFCMEIMHALDVRSRSTAEEQDKLPHIIPLLLDGYAMPEPDQLPDEMKELPMQNAIPLDISEIDEFYKKWLIDKKYLASKPRNLYMSQMDGEGIADFLFYANGDCDIFEFGNLIGSINQNIDEEHPLKLPVKRSGEHRFRCRNNDTCEELMLKESIAQGDQKYVSISWIQQLGLWDLTEDDISRERDSRKLYAWGRGLYDGTSKHEPDVEKSFKCLSKSASLWNVDARDFIISHVRGLDVKGLLIRDCIHWYEKAAEYGSADANELLGRCYDEGIGVQQDFNKALEYGQKALDMRLQTVGEDNADVAMSYHNLGRAYHALGNYEKSLESYHTALDIRTKLYGDEHIEVANTCNNLGGVYQNMKDYDKSLEYYMRSLTIKEKILEDGHKLISSTLFNLGNLMYVQDKYDESIEWYIKAANNGYIASQAYLGYLYAVGDGVEKNIDKAIEWLLKAAEQGDDTSMNNLAAIYLSSENYDECYKWYLKSAENGNVNSMSNLAWCYQYGNGVEKNIDKAIEWYLKAAEQGEDFSMNKLAHIYSDEQNDYNESFKWFSKSAENDNVNSISNLAWCYQYGNGVEKNIDKAIEWYLKAAEQGYDAAMNNLAHIYNEIKDYDNCFKWFSKSAENGNVNSLSNLGWCYQYGNGVEKNIDKAIELYLKAAEEGDDWSMNKLGHIYSDELHDYNECYRWYSKSAENGNVNSISSLAWCYQYGHGVEKNIDTAIVWYLKAADQGDDYSMNNLAHIYSDELHDYDEGFKWYSKSAENGNANSIGSLGWCYQYGHGVEKNNEKAKEYYIKAAEQGDDFYMNKLAHIYGDELQDYDECFKWYSKSAENGNLNSINCVGWCYQYGHGVEKDIDKAKGWYLKSAEQGYDAAMNNLAHIYANELHDYDECFRWYSKSAENGNVNSISNLGWCYQFGNGVKKDIDKAIEWYLKAAEQGDDWSMNRLAHIYSDELQDYDECFKWFSKSAENRNLNSMSNLGWCYQYGHGVEKNIDIAIELYLKAAEQGNDYSMNKLAHIYSDELHDYDECFKWYSKSSENGNQNSMGNLGWCYHYGHGVEIDFKQAIKWYEKAGDDYSYNGITDIIVEYFKKNDFVNAFACIQKTSGHENAKLMDVMGRLYFIGKGVQKDYSEAMKWYNQAYELKDITAAAMLEFMYRKGRGVKKNLSKAKEYEEVIHKDTVKAYDFNEIAWHFHLVGLYDEALPWAIKATEGDPENAHSLDTLASVYQGLGDYDKAMELFDKTLDLYRKQNDQNSINRTEGKIADLKALIAKKTKSAAKAKKTKSTTKSGKAKTK